MVESEGAEVLVLHGDHAAGPRHVHHLAEDSFGVPHVEEHGDRENAVEAIGREAQPRAVSHRVDEARPEAGTAARRRAARVMIWLGSTPTTCPRDPTRRAASRVTMPVPEPISSTHWPRRIRAKR